MATGIYKLRDACGAFVARSRGAREIHTDMARQWRDFCSSENSLYCERNENGFLNVAKKAATSSGAGEQGRAVK
jgi:hypothetical protein